MPPPKNVEMRALRAIEELIRNHEIQRRVLLLHRSNRTQGKNALNTQAFSDQKC